MTQTIQQLLTEFATYLGEQDKAILAQIETKITQLKNDLLGGEVSADLDTFRELAEELRKLKASGSTIPEALTTKMTEFKQSLDDVIEKLNALNAMDLKSAYQQGTKTQWVQKVTVKPGTVFNRREKIKVKVNPNLTNKICVIKLGNYSTTLKQLGEYFETSKNENAFPIYFIALADPEQVDFVSEVG